MFNNKISTHKTLFLSAAATMMFAFCLSATAQTEIVLHNFNGATNDGSYPQRAGLLGLNGKFFGDTVFGGAHGLGIVYELTPRTGANWPFAVLYSFAGGNDGQYPIGPLISDAAGNLYGVTNSGGVYGAGTVYKLSKITAKNWKKTVLWSLGAGSDGAYPYGGLAIDRSGNLFGTTADGGVYQQGTVFEVSPTSGGGWTEKVLHDFGASPSDGVNPYDHVIIDAGGNLFGTTAGGGSTSCDPYTLGCGVVFELSLISGGWTENIIHSFENNGIDGFYTLAPLTLDSAGNLYGTTGFGGDGGTCMIGNANVGCGVVFKLSPSTGNSWTEQILYAFPGGSGGNEPDSGVLLDNAGNIYGNTAAEGSEFGAVYRLTRSTSGNYTSTILVNFTGPNGNYPQGELIFAGKNRILGTTNSGGSVGAGTVFELVP